MFTKEKLEQYLNRCMSMGADFAELYIQQIENHSYQFLDSKMNFVKDFSDYGIGIRIFYGDRVLYGSVNELTEDNINRKIDELISVFGHGHVDRDIHLVEEAVNVVNPIKIRPCDFDDQKKLSMFREMDKKARDKEGRIEQLTILFTENQDDIIVANSNGKYVKDYRLRLRLFLDVLVKDGNVTKKNYNTYGGSIGYELFDSFDMDDFLDQTIDLAVRKLDAIPCPGGEMPVILGTGFCGTIMHEAVGHTLEATTVGIGNSIMCGKLNQKIATDVLTLVDDGTIGNSWGSSNVDDEGNCPQRNVLIENGVVKNYLVDMKNSIRMNIPSNGCGRRQDYSVAPTSRMSNTFIVNGTTKFEEMIKSVDEGLFVRKMNGGTVSPETGDFNFNASSVCMIRNGKLAEEVDSAMLIGNALEILQRIEMVGENYSLDTGFCGSVSGMIPVTVGEPYIKVTNMLVGGSDV